MGVFDSLLQPPERKALFMVGTGNSERKGIGCAVECEGKYYVLTCRDVASPEDAGADNRFVLDRYCSKFPKHVDRHRQKSQGIRYDDKCSFLHLPDGKVLCSPFRLSADDKKRERVYSYVLNDDGKQAQSIDWSYDNNTRNYSLSVDRDLDRKNFLGSPVLYSDKNDKAFVVGVVVKEENTYHPIFFKSASLPIRGKKL